jgi:predicted nucleotidyltransferase
MKTDKTYTLFDIFDIQYRLEKQLNRKIDIVEKDFIKPAAWEGVKHNLIAIV